VYLSAPDLLPWLSPVLAGLILAVPIAVLSSRVGLGLAARRHGWFLIPEEIAPPKELGWLALEGDSSRHSAPDRARLPILTEPAARSSGP
jgi:membrane glycosyltransferase